mgnify:CR=1 FL=1
MKQQTNLFNIKSLDFFIETNPPLPKGGSTLFEDSEPYTWQAITYQNQMVKNLDIGFDKGAFIQMHFINCPKMMTTFLTKFDAVSFHYYRRSNEIKERYIITASLFDTPVGYLQCTFDSIFDLEYVKKVKEAYEACKLEGVE